MIKVEDLTQRSLTINENYIVMIEPFDVETRQSDTQTTVVHCSRITLTTGHIMVVSVDPDLLTLWSGLAEKEKIFGGPHD